LFVFHIKYHFETSRLIQTTIKKQDNNEKDTQQKQ
jgi:hypothetical protein